ncbi:hypothetical protein ABFX02_08G209800 [Erythranthe guttata]
MESTTSRSNCKKHKRHIQSHGVCSICLSEKLSQLISTPITNNNNSLSPPPSSSSSSYDLSSLSSSSNPSSCSSPMAIEYSRQRLMESSKSRRSTRVFKNVVLNKSRSMAFISDENGKNSKRGFWSKFLPKTRKGLLMHSKTMRERAIQH